MVYIGIYFSASLNKYEMLDARLKDSISKKKCSCFVVPRIVLHSDASGNNKRMLLNRLFHPPLPLNECKNRKGTRGWGSV